MPEKPVLETPVGPNGVHFSLAEDGTSIAGWTEIEAGRFLPRRVRGSYLGRALG